MCELQFIIILNFHQINVHRTNVFKLLKQNSYVNLSSFNSNYALQKAKSNVEQHYAVVGVLEELELSLQVLEKYVPLFFNGALDVYRGTRNLAKYFFRLNDTTNYNVCMFHLAHATPHINRNIYKPPVSPEVKRLLRQNFTREIEFYEFCKQRLHAQYAALAQNKII